MENLRVQELRIGNLVILCGNVYEIAEIRADGKFRTLSIKKRRVSGVINKENIKQIPLTEEWLLKLGFKLYPSGSYCFDLFSVNEYLAIDLKYNKGFAYIRTDEDSLKIKLKYVHQLQNLYFALTNLELEIN